jgi:putative aldouronate transport system substrate-binding protein
MRKMRKRLAGAAVALTALSLALAGCGSNNNGTTTPSTGAADTGTAPVTSTSASATQPAGVTIDDAHSQGAMDSYDVGTTFKATEPITSPMLYRDHPNYTEKDDWMIFQQLTANQNISFKLTKIDLGDWQTKRGLYITTDPDEPEVIPVFYSGEETQYVGSGALLPISDYVQYMPNFEKDLQDFGLSNYLDTKRQADGKYYLLPGLMEISKVQYSIIVRDDWWQAAGITSDPTTLDELKADLQKLKDDGKCSIPLTAGNDAKDIAQAWSPDYNTILLDWAIQSGAQMWDGTSNQYVAGAEQPGAKELTSFMAGLVQDGLMDKESMTQGTQNNDASDQKFENGTACAITGNDQDLNRDIPALNAAAGINTTGHMLTLPQASDGKIYIPGGTRFSSGIVFGASLANDPHFKAILQFVDWLYFSPEGVEFAQWGVQCPAGVTDDTKCTYTKAADGTRTLLPTVNNTQGLNPSCGSTCKMLTIDYGFSAGPFWPANGTFKDLMLSYYSAALLDFNTRLGTPVELQTAPPTPLDQDSLDQISTYAQTLRDAQNTWTTDFIVGNKSVDTDWDAYQSELKADGLDDVVQIFNDHVQK